MLLHIGHLGPCLGLHLGLRLHLTEKKLERKIWKKRKMWKI